jgi:hypothetical protein
LAAVGFALAILVAVVVLTPFGTAQLARFGWSKGLGHSGVELSVGSASGGLLRGFALRDVAFTAPDGTTFFEASEVSAHIAAFSWGGKVIELDRLRVTGAALLFAPREGGGSVGWSDFRRDPSDEEPDDDARPWTVGLDGELADVTVEVRRPDTGAHVVVGPAGGTLSGTVAEFEASLAGTAHVALRNLSEPVHGRFTGAFGMGADLTLSVSGLELATNVGEAVVEGSVILSQGPVEAPRGPFHGPGAVLHIESIHDVPQLSAFVRAPSAAEAVDGGTGRIWLSSDLSGPFIALTYSSRILAEDVALRGARIELLEASLTGDVSSLEVSSLHAESAGGSVDAKATVGFPSAGADPGSSGSDPASSDSASSFPHLDADLEFAGLDVARLAEFGTRRDARVGGTLDGTATVDWKSRGLSNLNAVFDLRVSDLTAGARELGAGSLKGRVAEGLLMSYGDCCGAELTGIGQLKDDGLDELEVSAEAGDLAALGSVLGMEALAGSGTARATLSGGTDALSIAASVDLPDLRYRHIQAGPVRVELSGADGSYDALFDAFGSTLLGSGTLSPNGEYVASANVRSFDLSRVVPDSLREAMALAGLFSGSASVSGELGGGFEVTGTVSDLDLAVRRQHAELTAPFEFAASPDSVGLTEARLAGTFGEMSVAGSYTAADAIDLDLTFSAAELSEVADLLPRLLEHPPHGQLGGTVQVEGTRASPRLTADVSLRDFEMLGLSLDSATLEATADSSEVVFYVSAESTESGSVWLSGAAPVRPDSLTVWAFDADREFGMSLASEGFILDARDPILPGVRGEKRFRLTGSVLLVGTADSLSTITGSGLLSSASASFNLAELALADTVYFEVERGTLEFDQLVVAVTRRRVLGEPAGGTINAGGTISIDGETRLSASVTDSTWAIWCARWGPPRGPA